MKQGLLLAAAPAVGFLRQVGRRPFAPGALVGLHVVEEALESAREAQDLGPPRRHLGRRQLFHEARQLFRKPLQVLLVIWGWK